MNDTMMMRTPEKIGAATSWRPTPDEAEAFAPVLAAELAVDVLDHDDGGIDEDADGDGDPAERHQVGGDADVIHGHEGSRAP